MSGSRRFLWYLALAAVALAWAQGTTTDSSTARPSPLSSDDGGHKAFWPPDERDIATIILSMIGLVVAAGGGIGGGGILVPLFIIVLAFPPKRAIPLSNATILGGALSNTLFAVVKRHPRADRPLIDWDLILLMEPSTILGAVVGSFANKLLPGLVISVLLVVVLGALAHRTLSKGIKQFHKEGGFSLNHHHHHGSLVEKTPSVNGSLLSKDNPKSDYGSGSPTKTAEVDSDNDIPQEILSTRLQGSPVTSGLIRSLSRRSSLYSADVERGSAPRDPVAEIMERERYTALWKPAILTLCFLGIVVLDVLKGGQGKSVLGFRCGSLLYWVTTLATVPWVVTIFLIIRAHVLHDYETKIEIGYPFQPDDIKWSHSNTIRYPLLCCTAGLFAGIFGVGGGIVKGPLMLEMGVAPPVAAASAATMILYTSAAATVAFYVFDLIPLDYGLFYFCWGFICTSIGQAVVNHLLAKYKKESSIVLSIGIVIFLSAILMAYESVRNFIQDPTSALRASSLCG